MRLPYGGFRALSALLALSLALSAFSCSGNSATTPSGAAPPVSGLAIRLIGFDQTVLDGNLTPGLLLIAGVPPGADRSTYDLQVSTDGITFNPHPAAPITPAPFTESEIWQLLPLPPANLFFRIDALDTNGGTIRSNVMKFQPLPPAGLVIVPGSPLPGAVGVARTPQFDWSPFSNPNFSFGLFVISPPPPPPPPVTFPPLVWIAEVTSAPHLMGGPGSIIFHRASTTVGPVPPLAPVTQHRLVIMAIDSVTSQGLSSTVVDFTTG